MMAPVYAENTDFQSNLLTYYGQQLIAHGASLFALLSATFTFIRSVMPIVRKSPNKRNIITFLLFCGILLGGSVYVLFRMILYGYFVEGVIITPFEANYGNLSEYRAEVYNNVWAKVIGLSVLGTLLSHFTTLLGLSDFLNGFFLSLMLGFFGAFLIFYAFCKKEHTIFCDRIGLVWLIILAVFWIWAAYIKSPVSIPLKIVEYGNELILSIIVLISVVVIFFFSLIEREKD